MNEFYRELKDLAVELARLQSSVIGSEKLRSELDDVKGRVIVLEAQARERMQRSRSSKEWLKFWIPLAVTILVQVLVLFWES